MSIEWTPALRKEESSAPPSMGKIGLEEDIQVSLDIMGGYLKPSERCCICIPGRACVALCDLLAAPSMDPPSRSENHAPSLPGGVGGNHDKPRIQTQKATFEACAQARKCFHKGLCTKRSDISSHWPSIHMPMARIVAPAINMGLGVWGVVGRSVPCYSLGWWLDPLLWPFVVRPVSVPFWPSPTVVDPVDRTLAPDLTPFLAASTRLCSPLLGQQRTLTGRCCTFIA
mmetsp:Transcript_42921/g.69724  ORF Transcript_42921/g.69724 Transcript_42921/m.69724 type:complete len:228 (+) Transcript_42921:1131-1814(+)